MDNALELKKKKKKMAFSSRNSMLAWKKDGLKAAIALAPAMILLAIFTLYPIVNTFIIAFFPEYNFNTGSYGGFSFHNFQQILNDDVFYRAIGNTVIMVLISVPLSIIISLLITVLLHSIKKLQGFFQVIFFLPYVTNGIAFGLVFRTIFAPNGSGLVNTVLLNMGLREVAWTGNGDIPYWAGLVVITVNAIWHGLAFKILIFLSGLQGIDPQYYQAAQIDATPKKRVFLRITIPLLSPMIMYITITSLIGAFKSYSSIVALFGETMGNKTFITAIGYVYEYFIHIQSQNNLLSISAAAAVVVFFIILIVTLLQMAYNKRRVHY